MKNTARAILYTYSAEHDRILTDAFVIKGSLLKVSSRQKTQSP